jgi:multidrug efflux system membrane fusion protein
MSINTNTSISGSGTSKGGKTRWIVIAVVAVLLVLILWHLFSAKAPEHKMPAQMVKVAQAVRGDMPVTLDEVATVTPVSTVTVLPNASVSGYLTEIGYQEGQDVQKDQFLAQIDPRPYQVLKQQAEAALAKDQATLAQARSDLARYDVLNKQKSIAEQTYIDQKFLVQQSEAAVKQDQANIAQYALDITYCRITAPVAGRVGLRLVDVGNYVNGSSSTGIVVITTMKPMLVQFGVAQNDIEKVVQRFNATGVKLPVTVLDSNKDKQLATGTLYAINNQMTASTGQTSMRATFTNDDEALWPNSFVNVRLLVDTQNNAVLVPTPAVLTGAPGTYVYLVNKDDTVSVHKVTIGVSDGKSTVITSGLDAGDTVVTDGTDRLSDKAQIKIASDKPAAQADGQSSAAHAQKPKKAEPAASGD